MCARLPCVSNLGSLAEFILTVRTDTRVLDVSWCKDTRVRLGDEPTTVLALRHEVVYDAPLG